MDVVATRTFRATPPDVTAIEEWINDVGQNWGESQRVIFSARLCAAEIAANIVEHGSADPAVGRIIVTLVRAENGIEVEIADTGRPFDPTGVAIAAPPRSLESAAIGRLGLRVVSAHAKELSYHHDGTYNRLRMRIPAVPS